MTYKLPSIVERVRILCTEQRRRQIKAPLLYMGQEEYALFKMELSAASLMTIPTDAECETFNGMRIVRVLNKNHLGLGVDVLL